MMRVPEPTIEDSDDVFRHMLGLIRGRVYYNLLNWYRVLALLPGFQANRGFMEQMMGVKEGLPAEVAAHVPRTAWRLPQLTDGSRFAGSLFALRSQPLPHPSAHPAFSVDRQVRKIRCEIVPEASAVRSS